MSALRGVGCVLLAGALGCTSSGAVGVVASSGQPDAALAVDGAPEDACAEGGCNDGRAPDCSEAGTCPECSQASDCADGKVCSADGTCVQCLSDEHCLGAETSICAPWGECERPCLNDAECEPSEQRCAPNSQVCVECLANTDCAESGAWCDQGECQDCTSADCAS